ELVPVPFERPCYNQTALQLGASRVIAASQFDIADFEFEIWIENAQERKVRTPKGSGPANGGAAGRYLKSQISNLRSQKLVLPDDDKCNREQTSRPRFRNPRSRFRN